MTKAEEHEFDVLVETVGKVLSIHGLTVGTVESCTAGLIGASIASISGASRYFVGGLTTYTNELKEKLAGVNKETIERCDVVSRQVATEMAEGGLKALGCKFCIAITGYMGNTGGNERVPNGTIHICVATMERTYDNCMHRELHLMGNRGENALKCVLHALELLRELMTKCGFIDPDFVII